MKNFIFLKLICFISVIIFFILSFVISESYIFYFNLFIISIFVIFSIYIFFFKSFYFVLLYPFLFSFFFVGISCFLIECENYIIEQTIYGFTTGATIRMLCYSLFFLILIIYITKIKFNKNVFFLINKQNYLFYFNIIFTICLIYLFFPIFKHGSALSLGVNRFIYKNLFFSFFYKKVLLLCINILPIIGINLCFKKKNNRIYSILLFLFFILLNILLGEKFTRLHWSIYYFFCPFFLMITFRKNFINFLNLKIIIKVVLVVTILSLFFYKIIFFHYRAINDSQHKFFFHRVVLQGHVYWKIDYLNLIEKNFIKIDNRILNEASVSDYWSGKKGLPYLMYEVSDDNLVDEYMENKVNFTMGFPAILIQYFGFFGTFFWLIIFSLFLGFYYKFLIFSLRKLNLLLLFFIYRFELIIQDIFFNGNLFNFFSLKFYIFLYIFFILFFVNKIFFKRKKNVYSKL